MVLERFRKACLKIRADKCHVLQREVNFLGFRVNQQGVGTQRSKVEAIINWPTPKNLKETRSFVGLCSYYRNLVQGFAGIAEPLHALTKKGAKWNWNEECQEAFEELKRRLTSAPIMTLPQDDDVYVLDTDASDCHIGAVLSVGRQNKETVVAYGSRLYSKAERNYCVTRKELLAVVYFTKLYRHYLLGRRFTIRTDHAALQWLKKTPEPIGQQSRWLEQLEAFDYVIVHREGRKHQNADAMSRIPCPQCRRTEEVCQVGTIRMAGEEDAGIDLWSEESVRRLQKEDPDIGTFYRLKEEHGEQKPEWSEVQGLDETTKTLWNAWEETTMKNNVLYRKTVDKLEMNSSWQMIAPVALRLKIVELSHQGMTGGHLGITRTKEQVRRRVYWPGWSKMVERYCKACEPCARYCRSKPPKQGQLQPMVVGMPWEVMSIDITGPHPKSSRGNVYILTAMDSFSKFAFAFPMRNQEAVTVAKILVDQVFTFFGTPMRILSDQGKNFESQLFQELCRCMNIEKVRTSSYKPSTNGQQERFHRTLNAMIAKVVKESQKDWDELLPQLVAAYRSSIHSTTGFSPNFIIFGNENRAPVDLVLQNPETMPAESWSINDFVARKQEVMLQAYASARSSLGVAASRRKRTYDFGVKTTEFRPQQKVWYYYPRRFLKRSKKFQFVYTGPYVVVKRLGAVNYLIRKNDRTPAIVVHADKLKACQAPLHSEVLRVERCTASVKADSPGWEKTHSEFNHIVVADTIQNKGMEAKRRQSRRGKKGQQSSNKPGAPMMTRTRGQQPKQPYRCTTCMAIIMGHKAWKQHSRRCAARLAALQATPLTTPEIHPVWSINSVQVEATMVFAPETGRAVAFTSGGPILAEPIPGEVMEMVTGEEGTPVQDEASPNMDCGFGESDSGRKLRGRWWQQDRWR